MAIADKIKNLANGNANIKVAPVIPAIMPDAKRKEKKFPLTDIQQAYWVGRQEGFSMGNIAAHGYLEVDSKALDLKKLGDALNQLIVQHDMLRAVINDDGTQCILPSVPLYEITCQKLDACEEHERAAALDAYRREMSHQVIDTTTWPLFDIRASRMPNEMTRLHISLDVLIFDALSIDMLSEQLREIYETGSLPKPLNFSYADYVHGLEALKKTPLYKDSQDYWRNKLDKLPPAPELNLACSPEKITQPNFKRRCRHLSKAQWSAFKQKSQRLGLTPSIAVLTAYAHVLALWSQQQKFSLNLTLFNRLPFHEEVNDILGDFTSVILLAIDLSKPDTFANHAKQLLEQLWQDMDHRHVSGVWVLRELNERRGNGGHMPVVFTSAMQPDADGKQELAFSWLGEITYTLTQTPQVWLDHQIGEDRGELVMDWDSVDQLFPEGMLDDMFTTFSELMEALCDSDALWHKPVKNLLPEKQCKVIASANKTEGELPSGLLHKAILEQVSTRTNSSAIVDEFGSISYGELGCAAKILAHALIAEGMKKDELVSILLPKSRYQIISVLGILQASGAYLPIETDYACDRIAKIHELAGVNYLVTTREIARQKNLLNSEIKLIFIDNLDSSLDEKEIEATRIARQETVSETDIAYVIYTSGSTGTPKGVVIDHRGALNTCVDINERFHVDKQDAVLALSALNFDLSVYDIFGVLGAGGRIVFPEPNRRQEPAHWYELIQKHRVTVWNTVPALMEIYASYLREVEKKQDRNLKLVMMSGDWIPLSLPKLIQSTCPDAQSFSLGGATEASIWSIYYPINTVDESWTSIPYGKPLLNQHFCILNNKLEQCPIWVPGELHIGGVGVAKGYWKDEERSNASFITHPDTGERLYKTGDLGRYLPDGNIEFLGRKDFQVKVNGYRVELGEIETQMLAYPEIMQAVVTLNGESDKSKSLSAYYVRSNESQDPSELEKFSQRIAMPGLRKDRDCKRLPLPGKKQPDTSSLRRKSERRFSQNTIKIESISNLLRHLAADNMQDVPKYRYASAGGLYPVQTYLYVKAGRVHDVEEGLYYYHPAEHALVAINTDITIGSECFASMNIPVYESAAFALFFIAHMNAIEPHYGKSDSDTFTKLEAGLMTQIIEEAAGNEGLGTCQIGGFDFAKVKQAFNLSENDSYLHCLLGGEPLAEKNDKQSSNKEAEVRKSNDEYEVELKQYLTQHLPEYMVPKQFIKLDALPLSANGKIDRKALPKPSKKIQQREYVKPDSELADLVCRCWQEVLGVERVSVNDTFFEAGGTSVEMIKVHTKLQGKLPKRITLIDMFFTYPNISSLVAYLEPETGGEKSKKPAPSNRRRSLAGQRSSRNQRKNK